MNLVSPWLLRCCALRKSTLLPFPYLFAGLVIEMHFVGGTAKPQADLNKFCSSRNHKIFPWQNDKNDE